MRSKKIKQHKRQKKEKKKKTSQKKKHNKGKALLLLSCNEIVATKRKLNLIVNIFVPMVH
jgi:hypothetical protein